MENIIRKAGLICVQGKKVLMVRSRGKNTFYIPGGKIEGSETPEDALIREVEELSVHLLRNTLIYEGRFRAHAQGKGNDVFVEMICYRGVYIGFPMILSISVDTFYARIFEYSLDRA